MSVTTGHRIFSISIASVYPLYIAKVEKKGRTRDELDAVIRWLTGYDDAELERHLSAGTTLEGFFAGRDLDWRARLGPVDGERIEAARRDRAERRAGFGPDLRREAHRLLAEGPAQLVAVQLDDLAGAVEQQNLPGTIDEHPNWRRRLPIPVEDWERAPALD